MSAVPAFDEMTGPAGGPRPAWAGLKAWLDGTPLDLLHRKRDEAEALFRRLGITFYLYGDGASAERMIPFDVLPRILSAAEWATVERGCIQRVAARSTCSWHDIYHDREILRAGRIPADLVIDNIAYRPEMAGIDLPGQVYCHIAGIDIVRTGLDDFFVLEDNLRTPSGVSYMLENRETMMRLFPDLFAGMNVRLIGSYPDQLLQKSARRRARPAGPTRRSSC